MSSGRKISFLTITLPNIYTSHIGALKAFNHPVESLVANAIVVLYYHVRGWWRKGRVERF